MLRMRRTHNPSRRPDGRTVARVRSGRLWFDDTLTGDATARPEHIRATDAELVWSSDARWLLSVGGGDTFVTLWNPSTGSVYARSDRFRADGGGPVLATFSPDAKHVFVHDGVSLHTLATTNLRPTYPAIDLPMDSGELVAHPDGSVFVAHRDGGWLVRMDPRTGDVVDRAYGPLSTDDVEGLMSPDGTRMMVTGPGVQVRLLDVEKQKYIDSDSGFQWGAPAFAPDGSQYAVAEDGRIRLWDGRTGDYQASLPLPGRVGTYSITYQPDSSRLVIASTDGSTWVAETRVDQWDDRACAVAARNLSRAEWKRFFPNAPYEATCPQWPPGT